MAASFKFMEICTGNTRKVSIAVLLLLNRAMRWIPWNILLQQGDVRFDPHIATAAGISADDYGYRFALIKKRRRVNRVMRARAQGRIFKTRCTSSLSIKQKESAFRF